MTPNKDLNKLLKVAKKRGAEVRLSRKSHVQVLVGGNVVAGSSLHPGWSALRNFRADLRRLGLTK